MNQLPGKNDIIEQLRREILAAQGFRALSGSHSLNLGLAPLEAAFPNQTFPVAAIHEFLSPSDESAAAGTGFISGLLSRLLLHKESCLWISTKRTLFPPALAMFGVAAHKVIFLDLACDSDALWVMEEALKCEALGAVVGEISEINLTQSRRLQLAVEQSRVTGLLHRIHPRKIENIAAVSRWQISPLASAMAAGIPGVGHPQWKVDLLKIRNGKPGSWQLQWIDHHFETVQPTIETDTTIYKKTG